MDATSAIILGFLLACFVIAVAYSVWYYLTLRAARMFVEREREREIAYAIRKLEWYANNVDRSPIEHLFEDDNDDDDY
jgi:CHASE3 domain sensor protein